MQKNALLGDPPISLRGFHLETEMANRLGQALGFVDADAVEARSGCHRDEKIGALHRAPNLTISRKMDAHPVLHEPTRAVALSSRMELAQFIGDAEKEGLFRGLSLASTIEPNARVGERLILRTAQGKLQFLTRRQGGVEHDCRLPRRHGHHVRPWLKVRMAKEHVIGAWMEQRTLVAAISDAPHHGTWPRRQIDAALDRRELNIHPGDGRVAFVVDLSADAAAGKEKDPQWARRCSFRDRVVGIVAVGDRIEQCATFRCGDLAPEVIRVFYDEFVGATRNGKLALGVCLHASIAETDSRPENGIPARVQYLPVQVRDGTSELLGKVDGGFWRRVHWIRGL